METSLPSFLIQIAWSAVTYDTFLTSIGSVALFCMVLVGRRADIYYIEIGCHYE